MVSGSASRSVRFLLDENLSWRVGKALRLCEYAVTHVELEDDLGSGTPDEEIIPWCGRHGRVWVTVDHDARARPIRFALLPEHGVHVILLDPEPKGLHAQLERIVRRYPEWVRELTRTRKSSGVWVQGLRGILKPLWRR